MTLALLPLGAIALWQTQSVVNSTIELSRAAVLFETDRAAANERKVLERGRGTAHGLAAAVSTTWNDAAACSEFLRTFIDSQSEFVFAGFIDVRGDMNCASAGGPMNFADDPMFDRAMERQTDLFDVTLSGAITGQSVMLISTPVMSAGELVGFLSLSVPHVLNRTIDASDIRDQGIDYVTVNAEGRLLSSTVALDQAGTILPRTIRADAIADETGETFVAEGVDGRERLFAVSTLIPGQVSFVGSWPVSQSQDRIGSGPIWLPLLFPVLMWLAGVSVAFFGLHRLVIRHIYHLRRAMRRFANGERENPDLDLVDPPVEFDLLESSFNRMVEALMAAEAKAEQDLEDKTVLLREVHHRVKNNLQLITSIINMHNRTAQSPEAKLVLTRLQRRVRGLATAHQTLHTASDRSVVNGKMMLEHLARELAPSQPVDGHIVQIKTEAASVPIAQDQAVAISMLAAEALSNATEHVRAPQDGPPELVLRLERPAPDELCLAVTNTISPEKDDATHADGPSGIGVRLMRAFVAQLGGSAQQSVEGDRFRYSVTFPMDDVVRQIDDAPAELEEGHVA